MISEMFAKAKHSSLLCQICTNFLLHLAKAVKVGFTLQNRFVYLPLGKISGENNVVFYSSNNMLLPKGK
jgi:hypothetical protein